MSVIDIDEIVGQVVTWTGGSVVTVGFREEPDGAGGRRSAYRIVVDANVFTGPSLVNVINQVWVFAGSP